MFSVQLGEGYVFVGLRRAGVGGGGGFAFFRGLNVKTREMANFFLRGRWQNLLSSTKQILVLMRGTTRLWFDFYSQSHTHNQTC